MDREIRFLVGVLVILPIALDMFASYAGHGPTNVARAVVMFVAYTVATRYETHKLRRER